MAQLRYIWVSIYNIINIIKYLLIHIYQIAADASVCELLINKGADVNSTNNYGKTPLHRGEYL